MQKSKFADIQIIRALKRVKAGLPVRDICQELGVLIPTFYRRRARFASMNLSMVPLVQEHDDVKRRIKRMYLEAEITIEYLAGM